MRTESSPDARAIQPRLLDRLATSLTRYRLNRKRSRMIRQVMAAALLVVAAVMATVSPAAGTASVTVLVTTRDLAAGATLAATDISGLAMASPPDGAMPASQHGDAVGEVLSGAMRRGEVVTDARILTDRGPDPGPGRAAIPIPLADAALVDLLRPGMHVVLVRLAQAPGTLPGIGERGDATDAPLLTTGAVVLSIPDVAGGGIASSPTRMAIVAVPVTAADAVTSAASQGTLTVRFGQ